MKNFKLNTLTITTIILALLLVSSPFIASSSPVSGATVGVVVSPDYGDLLQYEWPFQGGDAEHTGFSSGPGPNKPDVLWSYTVPGRTGSDLEVGVFNGKAYVITNNRRLIALDAFTGEVKWNSAMPYARASRAGVYKISDEYLVIPHNYGFMCFKTTTGELAWMIEDMVVRATILGAGRYQNDLFVPELKIMYAYDNDIPTLSTPRIVALNMSDPSRRPTIAWSIPETEGWEVLCYGDRKVFLGSSSGGAVLGLNALTGEILWRTPKTGMAGYSGVYYRGLVYCSGSSTTISAFNATTGKLEWEYDAGHFNWFAWTGATAYGKYYQPNYGYLDVPWVGAWDAKTGDLLWKQPATSQGGYIKPIVADGKLYVNAGLGRMRTTCYDAATGTVLWAITNSFGKPAIAYGNLYGTDGTTFYCIGSSKPWSMWRGNTDIPGVAVGQSGPSTLTVKWKYKTGDAVSSSPAVVDGKLYVGSHDKNLYCLDSRTGALIWKFPFKTKVLSSPAVVDGRLYTGADDGYIHCINAETGAQIWNTSAGGVTDWLFQGTWQPRSSPIIVGNRLYVGALDYKVYCLDTATGHVVWTYTTGKAIGASPAVSKGVVYIPSTDAYVYALNATDGDLKWQTLIPGATTGVGLQELYGSPVVGEGKVFVGGAEIASPMFYCLNATTGSVIWAVELLGGETPAWTPAYYKGLLYMSNGMRITQMNAADGSVNWMWWMGHQVWSSPIYAEDMRGGLVYGGSDGYRLECLDTTGEQVGWYHASAQIQSSAAIWEGKLYIGSNDHYIYCFDDSPIIPTNIAAVSNKGTSMNANESVVISGKLYAAVNYSETEVYYPEIPNANIKVTFVKPDKTTVDVTATTDERGFFEVSYTPTAAGNWTWVAWYEGADYISHSYAYSYGSDMPLTVQATTPPPPPPPPPTSETSIPIEAVYAGIAIVVIVVIAAIAYFYMKRGKK